MEQKVHWEPQPTQTKALVRIEDEILYGGARGRGKTDAGQAWLLYNIDKPYYRALVIRRNADDLRDWVDRARKMYAPTGAEFTGNPVEIRFPTGALIRTGHLKDAGAYTKYQGHEYQKILIEELTHISREKDYEALLGSCRSTHPDIKPQVFCTTNPDGDGFYWIKKRWNIPDRPSYEPIVNEVNGRKLVFIFSKLEDNKYLLQDKNYVNYLESISDDTLRKQWREGDWSEPKIEGSYYGEQLRKATDENRITKVPYDARYPVHTVWDLGMSDSTSIWFVQQMGLQIRIIDYYENSGEGLAFYAKILKDKGYIYGSHFAPHDIEVRELGTGVSRLEVAKSLGIQFRVVPNLQIIEGINATREFFHKCWFDQEKCKEGIECLKNYRKEYDEKRDEYKSHPLHNWASHGADAFRYLAIAMQQNEKKELNQGRQQLIQPNYQIGFRRR